MEKKKIKIISVCGIVIIIAILTVIIVFRPTKVEGAIVNRGTIKSCIKGTGKVEAGENIDVHASVSAIVKTASFKVGDSITQSDKLISYDLTKLEEAKKLAEQNVELKKAELTAAKSTNAKNITDYNSAKNSNANYESLYQELKDQMNTFDSNEHHRNLSITEIQKSIENQKADAQKRAQNLQNDLTALQSKLEGKIAYEASDSDYKDSIKDIQDDIEDKKDAINATNNTIADLEKRELALPEKELTYEEYCVYLELQQNLTDVQREWEASRSKEQTAHSQIVPEDAYLAYQMGISIAETELVDANRNFEIGSVGEYSNCPGIISEKYVSDGSYVSVGDPLYTIKSTETTKAIIQISKYDYPYIEIGQRADIKIGDLKYEGTVTKIDKLSTTDTSGKSKVSVEVTFANADENIIYGLDADVTIYTQEKADCICVAYDVVYSDDTGDYCYMIQDGQIIKKYIETGVSDSNLIEIVSGLNEGEQVISQPMTDDNVGKKVRY